MSPSCFHRKMSTPGPLPVFRFEPFWLLQPDFISAVKEYWVDARAEPHRAMFVEDEWHHLAKRSSQFMKVWAANIGRDLRVFKAPLLADIQIRDIRVDSPSLSSNEWALRYSLEDSKEEEYWRRQGSIGWTLWGDANTTNFQAIMNGRRRRAPSHSFGMVVG
ncbi:hypothetical protein D1007_37262 [Hordeum vulgare]|nr:hypothetical protein D1007_37262 [Hordeum vulgare]